MMFAAPYPGHNSSSPISDISNRSILCYRSIAVVFHVTLRRPPTGSYRNPGRSVLSHVYDGETVRQRLCVYERILNERERLVRCDTPQTPRPCRHLVTEPRFVRVCVCVCLCRYQQVYVEREGRGRIVGGNWSGEWHRHRLATLADIIPQLAGTIYLGADCLRYGAVSHQVDTRHV